MRLAPPCLLTLALAAACGGGGGSSPVDAPDVDAVPTDASVDAMPAPPVFRHPLDLADRALAEQAVALLGQGPGENCDACHSLTRARLRLWDQLTDDGAAACLTDLAPTTPAAAMQIVTCLRTTKSGHWEPGVLGINATAASLPWFEYVFRLAYGAAWEAPFAEWKGRVEMPRGDRTTFTQAEFDVVAEWFARGLPALEDVIPVEPPPPPCTTEIQPAVAAHVTAMRTQGWRALNRDAGILMYGCAGAAGPRDCLADQPLSTAETWSAGWTTAAPGTRIRMLHALSYSSSFWTRSSADGRFVSHGGGPGGAGASVIDLTDDREVPAAAYYDPGFFPDNSGFVLQGSGAFYCRQSLLTGRPAQITFGEAACTRMGQVGLYQHVGAVSGGDYWTVHGRFTSDFGGGTEDPWAEFGADTRANLTPMVHDGQAYVARPTVSVATPDEGDTVIAPSSKLLISRTPTSFVLRGLQATRAGDTYTVDAPVTARYCVRGGKPAFSYDERWLVYHHYVEAGDWASLGYASATDPGFVALRQQGASNLFVLDLLTGESRRITTMGPGQFALFPHFRSDGWIYALVKASGHGEHVIASDAALVFEQP